MPLQKFSSKTYNFGLPPYRPRISVALPSTRQCNIVPASNLSGTFVTIPTNTILFTPIFVPTNSRIRTWYFRCSSQTSIWGQTSNLVFHGLNVSCHSSDKLTGLPSTTLQSVLQSLSSGNATNSTNMVSFGNGQAAEAGLIWMGFINTSGTTYSLAGTQPSSGPRSNAGQIIFQKAIGQSSTGSIFPYGLALGISGTTIPSTTELNSAVLQYNTSPAAQGYFRLRTNVPWASLYLERTD